MSKTIFATTFCSELSILEIQLQENADLFSDIIIVEAAQYHNGDKKDYILEYNWNRFRPWHDKIHYVKLDMLPEPNPADPFLLDRTHRNYISAGLEKVGVDNDTLTFYADADEIVKHDYLQEYLKSPRDFVVFQGEYRVYKLNLRCVDKIWNGLTGFRGKIVLDYPPHTLIKMRDRYDNPAYWNEPSLIRNSLNHLGYQKSAREIWERLLTAAEPFCKKTGVPSWQEFEKLYNTKARPGGSFIFSDQPHRNDLQLELTDLTGLPKCIIENQEKYKELLWK